MNARSFRAGALAAFEIIEGDRVAYRMLHGAVWLFQVAGVAGIGTLGGVLVSVYRMEHEGFSLDSEADDESQRAFARLVFFSLGGAVSMFIAVPFLLVLGGVSDTLLYCSEVESQRKKAESWDPVSDAFQYMCVRQSMLSA